MDCIRAARTSLCGRVDLLAAFALPLLTFNGSVVQIDWLPLALLNLNWITCGPLTLPSPLEWLTLELSDILLPDALLDIDTKSKVRQEKKQVFKKRVPLMGPPLHLLGLSLEGGGLLGFGVSLPNDLVRGLQHLGVQTLA